MLPLMLFDWFGDFITQIIAQCQLWCLVAGLIIMVVVLAVIGAGMLQLIETLEGNSIGPGIQR